MTDCLEIIRARIPSIIIESRIDSAFFNDSVFPILEDLGVEFTCSVPFQRFSELKGFIEERKRWRKIDSEWSYFELEWRPKCWETSYRLICIRQRLPVQEKGPIQLDLFEPKSHQYNYTVIATNKTCSAKYALLFHHGRGSQEKLFGEAKQNTALDVIPTRRKNGNIIFTLCGMLAHNLTREIQMATYPAQHGTRSKRPAIWKFLSLKTIRQKILHRAGTLQRPQGKLTLKMNATPEVQTEITQFLDALQKAA